MKLDLAVPSSGVFGPMPKFTQRGIEVRVRFDMETKGFREASAKLRRLIRGEDVVLRLFQAAVVRSVVVNIRRRFLNTMEKALEMKVVKENGRDVAFSPRARMRDIELKRSLQRTLERLNEAQIDGDYSAADKLQERALRAQARLQERLQQAPNGRPLKSHSLSVLAGNQFRRRMMGVLGLITDSAFVQPYMEGSKLTVGVGPTFWLDQIETPSATAALTGTKTTSKYRIMWRHLEFGTGVRRSAAKDRLNQVGKPAQRWWYGRKKRASLLLDGTAPMNFLTSSSGEMFPNDYRDLGIALTQALDAVLTVAE